MVSNPQQIYRGLAFAFEPSFSPWFLLFIGTILLCACAVLLVKSLISSSASDREYFSQLQRFVSQAPVAIAMFDHNMRYLACSQRWLTDCGIQDRDLRGECHYDVFPSIPAHWRQAHQRGLAGESLKDEDTWIASDGAKHHIYWEIQPWGIPGSSDAGIFIFMEDVTRYRAMEEDLRRKSTLLSEMGHTARIGGWSLDAATGEVAWTDEIFKIYDLEPSSIPTFEARMACFTPSSRAELEAAIDNARASAVPYDLELQLRTLTGKAKWVRAICKPVVEHGKVRELIGSFQDISDLKAVESELRESESKFKTYLEIAPFGILVLDLDGKIIDFNRAAVQMCGTSADRLHSSTIFDFHVEAEAAKVKERLEHLRNAGSAQAEFSIIREDGKPFWLSVYGFKLGNGMLIEFLLDLNEKKESDARIKRLESQFKHAQKMESLGRLAGGIAHDFNNLLMAIQCQSDLLLQQHLDSESARSKILQIMNLTERGASVTRQLLAISRKHHTTTHIANLNAFILSFVDSIRCIIGESIKIETDLPSDVWPIEASEDDIAQVMLNLCVNSRDAMPEGGRILIATRNDSSGERERVRIAISDTGAGMPPDELEKIFEPFYTTKDYGKGTGLGLSTVYGIVSSLGGQVEVESSLNVGTTFDVLIPRSKRVQAQENSMLFATTCAKGTERILVIEDEHSLRVGICEWLSTLGYKVSGAESGFKALEILQNEDEIFDLLITDVVMPEMSGKELSLRADQLRPGLRTLFMSGYDRDVLTDSDTDHQKMFIQKPFNLATMSLKVREILDSAVVGKA